jgi:internalin A
MSKQANTIADRPASPGRIVTFYSYKGGVGRTLALANLAVLLARLGKRVLMVDFDLEAPGLHRYFREYIQEPNGGLGNGAVGLLPLLRGICNGRSDETAPHIQMIRLPSTATLGPIPEPLYFLPSGLGSEEYAEHLQQFSWSEFMSKYAGIDVIDSWRRQWTQSEMGQRPRFDIVFIDSRTGLTDHGSICTILLPDFLVLCLAANRQNLDGAKAVAMSAQDARQDPAVMRSKLTILPLLSRFEGNDEFEDGQKWLSTIGDELAFCYSNWLPEPFTPRRMLTVTKIPYIPKFSFGEPLPVVIQGIDDPTSIGFAMQTSARLIESGFLSAAQILDPENAEPRPRDRKPPIRGDSEDLSIGRTTALARIATEKQQRTGFLDLGNLRLEEWPDELWELEHLTELTLGNGWATADGKWHQAESDLGGNILPLGQANWNMLPRLRRLALSGSVLEDLNHLAGLHELQALDCSGTQVGSLEPLAGLHALQALDCSGTQVSSLEPLAGLDALQTLDCSGTQVSSLEPLAGLPALQTLDCSGTQVSSLEPLAGLPALQTLDCSGTQVSSLEPLAGLAALQSLNCSFCKVRSLPEALIWQESLRDFFVFDTRISYVPTEVLSSDPFSNCLAKIRAHLRDTAVGDAQVTDVKILVLGNGRVGKTQICNRLRGQAFDPDADSTHGITVTTTPMRDATLHLWDFGGQDIYHGTHALFMRGPTVFLLVWTPDSENSATHLHDGILFRNRPLPYWLAYIRNVAGNDSPLVVVQNQCDSAMDERVRPPVSDEALTEFPFRKLVHYSAKVNRGRASLGDSLSQAIAWLHDRQGQARIGKGRLAVKNRIEAMQNADALIEDISQRRHRTITQVQFADLCAQCGGVTSPALLLDYLHQAGIVFYQEGLFDDRIIMDQTWALDAVYAVFNRQKCYHHLRQMKGRFTRTLLEALVWQQHGKAEQELFLSLMQSSGICFIHRKGDAKLGIENEYIAPDLLPDYAEVAAEVESQWDDNSPFDSVTLNLPFLHPGVMRGLLSRIGQQAGMTAMYWDGGVCAYEKNTRSHARIEQNRGSSPIAWSGTILIRAQMGQSADLVGLLSNWAIEEAGRAGCEIKRSEHVARARRAAIPQEDAGAPKMEFAAPPNKGTYALSYAWSEDSRRVVDNLCKIAEGRGVHILRDLDDFGMGENLSKFMTSLAEQDRVFVILSDKYLRSEYCMFELKEVWRFCQQDREKFRQRVHVYKLPDAKIDELEYQLEITRHWTDKFEKNAPLIKELAGKGKLAESQLRRFNNLNSFAEHVGDILGYVADTLMPREFSEFENRGFDEGT